MFQKFGFGGVKCPRCEQKNDGQSGYCQHCGLTLGAPRNAPLLRDNRWIPADDELAVYFGVSALSGIFTKTLRVPAMARAYILQADKATEVPQGEYEIEGFFTRLNHLLRNQHGEILITRSVALPVSFEFEQLRTAEQLKVAACFTVSLAIEQVPAFARHFMTAPGTVSTRHLQELLEPSVRQLATEFIASRSIRDMADNTHLRQQLDERLQSGLKLRLASYGLAVERVETVALRHDKYDHNRERVGSLWLVADERQGQLEHARQLDQLYDAEEWQAIAREERKLHTDLRRAELKQDATLDKAELTLKESERLQALRAREVDLYSRIMEAKTRKVALDKGAGTVLADLEHELAKNKSRRMGEEAEWEHVRQLARIRMQTELEVLQQTAAEQRQLAQQRLSHQLRQQAIENQIENALRIEDEAHRRNQLLALRAQEKEEKQRELAIEAEAHQQQLQSLTLAGLARRREAERVQEWEDQQALARQRDLLRADAVKDAGNAVEVAQVQQRLAALQREGAAADGLAQHEKLLRTLEADQLHTRQQQASARQAMLDQLAIDEQRQQLRQQEHELQWQQELRKLDKEREERYACWKGDYDVLLAQQNHELARMETMHRISDTAKLATAAVPNVQALAHVMGLQIQAGMDAAQIHAHAQVVGAGQPVVSPADLPQQAPQARCSNGHPLRTGHSEDGFCATCGVALQETSKA